MSEIEPLPESVREAQAALRAGQPDPETVHRALQEQWAVEERPFTSGAPLIGPLLVAFRNLWNNVATRWYVQPLRQQQNDFNSLVVQQLNFLRERTADHAARLADLGDWLVEADRDDAAQARQLAELQAQVVQLKSSLDEMAATLGAGQQAADDS